MGNDSETVMLSFVYNFTEKYKKCLYKLFFQNKNTNFVAFLFRALLGKQKPEVGIHI